MDDSLCTRAFKFKNLKATHIAEMPKNGRFALHKTSNLFENAGADMALE